MKHLLLTTIVAVVLVGCAPTMSIHEAAEAGNIEVVKQHLAAGADLSAKNGDFSLTPLHRTKEIAELLIAEGADVNAKEKYRETPLNWAILLGQTATADLLRKHGGKTKKELEAAGK